MRIHLFILVYVNFPLKFKVLFDSAPPSCNYLKSRASRIIEKCIFIIARTDPILIYTQHTLSNRNRVLGRDNAADTRRLFPFDRSSLVGPSHRVLDRIVVHGGGCDGGRRRGGRMMDRADASQAQRAQRAQGRRAQAHRACSPGVVGQVGLPVDEAAAVAAAAAAGRAARAAAARALHPQTWNEMSGGLR